jgi:membrane protein DedA with SNARE-associated domain
MAKRMSAVLSKLEIKNPQTFAVKLAMLVLLAMSLVVLFDFIDDSFLDQALPHTPITFAGTTAYIANLTTGTLSSLGYVGLFSLLFLEGTSLPIPSEVILPFTGYLVSTGRFDYWLALFFATSASVLGALVDYAVGYLLGDILTKRAAKYSHVNQQRLLSVQKLFEKHGEVIVIVTRLIPGMRTLASFPAGAAKMQISRFVAYTALGSGIFNGALIYLGVYLGKNWDTIKPAATAELAIVGVLAIMIGWVLIRRRKLHHKQPENKPGLSG